MNKMDDFIKKQLTDFTPAEDGWNVPSDDMWDKAKIHFPQKPPSRWKPLIFYTLGFGLLVFGISLLNLNNDKTIINDSTVQVDQLTNSLVNDKASNQISLNENKILADQNAKKAASRMLPVLTEKELDTKKSNQAKSTTTIIDEQGSNTKQVKEELIQRPQKEAGVIKSFDQIKTTAKLKESPEPVPVQALTPAVNKAKTEEVKQVASTLKQDQKATPTTDLLSQKSTNKSLLVPKLARLNQSMDSQNFTALHSEKSISLIPLNNAAPFAIQPVKKHYRPIHEFGIATTKYFISLATLLSFEDSDGLSIDVAGDFFNSHFSYTKWIGSKWSISSGLSISNGTLSFNICDTNELSQDDLDEFIETNTNNILRNRRETERIEDLKINLVEGAKVKAGDLLTLKGTLGLSLEAVQVPFIFSRHFYRPNVVGFNLGLGGSLDFSRGRQAVTNLTITKAGEQINQPVYISEENIGHYDYSVFLQAGMRLRFTKNINLGITSRIFVRNPIFSGIEAGLYYRWI